MSQWTIAGRRKSRRWWRSKRSGRDASFRWLARAISDLSVTPFNDTGMASTQRVEIDAMAVVAGDHGEAGEAAFSGLGLQDERQTRAAGEIDQGVQHQEILALRRGSRSHVRSGRRSSRMSALSSMSDCSGIRSP